MCAQIEDMAEKLEQANHEISRSGHRSSYIVAGRAKRPGTLSKVVHDRCVSTRSGSACAASVAQRRATGTSSKLASETMHTLMTQILKNVLFNGAR